MKTLNSKQARCITLGIILAWLLGACATQFGTEPGAVEKDFGNSVRNMINSQKYTPPQPVAPPGAVPGMDGPLAEGILREYRRDISKPQEVKKEIVINVGGKNK